MEEHRLRTLDEYDEKLFNHIYQSTYNLRRKIARDINPHHFKVEYEDILSWLDIKLLYVFQKYHKTKTPDNLLGYVINSLKMYKFRILNTSYNQNNKAIAQTMQVEDYHFFEGCDIGYDEILNTELDTQRVLTDAMNYLKDNLSEDAFFLFTIELEPPSYIVTRMAEADKHNLSKIPTALLVEYLGLDTKSNGTTYVRSLKHEIQIAIESARDYFQKNEDKKALLS
jgi:hypothetical protein